MNSKEWIAYFRQNAKQYRVDWNLDPNITQEQISAVIYSLQAWQLGETSDGSNLLRAATKYAHSINDPDYIEAVKLFIKEEQKHGNNLGLYIDAIGEKRIRQDWGDSLFRKIRYFNTSMELWTLTVIVVESTAQIFYQSLKDASDCTLLKQICTDILIDEAYHITFQMERMSTIVKDKTVFGKRWRKWFYKLFFFSTTLVVWFAHKKAFKAGGNTFKSYCKKMSLKYGKTLGKLGASSRQALVAGEASEITIHQYKTIAREHS
ncbi:ferritin-like domain-containing protein [Pinibacter soli]|uniref:Ferritin-like domain-containing protein n=1 Tax=Pinibacter soli TaxID=3044211 RepID=A0ABT6RH02_9BACT|nr:ferritin-like domain-containing protein [Pinibacter soli]MDI3321848.1 ferritin-like domain-containing protein [Pinibacter soli]